MAQHNITLCVRFLQPRDLDDILRIERACFEIPWDRSDFCNAMRQENSAGMVIELAGIIRAFAVLQLFESHLAIWNLAVDPAYQRIGIGRSMWSGFKSLLLPKQGRCAIKIMVGERNLKAQLWLRAMGAKCVGIDHKRYSQYTSDDALKFIWSLPKKDRLSVVNRIKRRMDCGHKEDRKGSGQ